MKIAELIVLAEHKLATLNQATATAQASGDADALGRLEAEVAETQATLDELRDLGSEALAS